MPPIGATLVATACVVGGRAGVGGRVAKGVTLDLATDSRPSAPRSQPLPPPLGVSTQVLFENLCCLPAIPHSMARPTLHFSLIAQMDGILYKELKVRPEVDVLATSVSQAVSPHWGVPTNGVPLGAIEGLYWGPATAMPAVVAAVASQHGRGLFVLSPPSKGAGISHLVGNILGSNSGAAKARRSPWFDFLMQNCKMRFSFAGNPLLVGVYADFIHHRTLRAPPRLLRAYELAIVPSFGSACTLGPVPDVLSRATVELPDVRKQVIETTAREPDFAGAPYPPRPPPVKTTWNVKRFRQIAATHPDTTIRTLAIEAVANELNPRFLGDRGRAVRAKNSRSICGKEARVEAHLLAEAKLGHVWGPLEWCPFTHARICRLSVVDKNKWDVMCNKFRLISDYSHGGKFSVNELTFSPRLIALYARGCHVADMLAHLGDRAYIRTYDVPACYRNQGWAREFWPLFVYFLNDKFFVDMRHGFGLVASEYAWQCILAVLQWHLRGLRGWAPIAIVDNLFFIADKREADAMANEFVKLCEWLGLPLHEPQSGKVFSAVGWEWDVSGRVQWMICPLKKHALYTELAHRWAAVPLLSIETIERLLGLVVFLSAGFKVAKPDATQVYSFLAKMKVEAKSRHKSSTEVWIVKTERVQSILEFWKLQLVNWDRRCVIVASFSPVAQHERLGFVDAATVEGHGWGAVYLDIAGSDFLAAREAWTLDEGESAVRLQRKSTGELEIRGIVHWLKVFGPRCLNRRVLLLCDNMAACQGMASGFSPQPGLAEVIRLARQLVCGYNIVLRVAFISTHSNLVADALSHCDVAQAQCQAQITHGRPFRLLKCRLNGGRLPRH